jgi:hypothetical protein
LRGADMTRSQPEPLRSRPSYMAHFY